MLRLRRTADDVVAGLRDDVRTVARALEEVQESQGMAELLRYALHVANFLNSGSVRVCRGIRMKTLQKFAQVISSLSLMASFVVNVKSHLKAARAGRMVHFSNIDERPKKWN